MIAVIVVVPPLLGPALGLDTYRASTPSAGERVALPNGRHLNVVAAGEGEPVVLVHGLPGGAVQMQALARELGARGFRTILYDRMGWGHSSARQGELYSLEQNARELIELLDALHIEQANLVGYSYGGGVVQEAARIAPERIRSAVLLSSVGPQQTPRLPGIAQQLLFSPPVLHWTLSTQFTAMAIAGGSFTAMFAPDPMSRPDVDAQLATMAMGDSPTTWVEEAEQARIDIEKLEPERLVCPVLLLQGMADQIVEPQVAEALHKAIPGSRLERIDAAGHGMAITRAPDIAARIATFLNE